MNQAVHGLLLDLREALAIWLALVGLAVLACAALSAPARRGRQRRPKPAAPARARRTAPARRERPEWTVVDTNSTVREAGGDSTAAESRRYAEEVAVAAARAADAADRWRAEWLAVAKAKEAAWRAYEAAETAARRAFRAAAFPTPEEPLTPGECKARERYLRRAASEAYRRGELSLDQLNDALSHRNGWDPHLHPFEQDVILRRIGLARKLRAYQTVSAMERGAWETVESAEAAKASLRREAYAAALRARQAQRATNAASRPAYAPLAASRLSFVDGLI